MLDHEQGKTHFPTGPKRKRKCCATKLSSTGRLNKRKKNPKNSNYKSEYMQTERSMQVMNANSLNVHTSARTLYTFKPVCLNFTGQEMTHLFKD